MKQSEQSLQTLCNQVVQGSLSRRAFMTRATALGVSALAAQQMLTDTAAAQTPNIGGLLRVGTSGASTTDTLDPGLLTDAMTQLTSQGLLRNTLLGNDEHSNLVPELAESWETSADAATWVFQLHRGVEFHNGKSLEAEDVIQSLNRHRGESSDSAAKSLLEQVDEMRADGKDKVVIALKDGNADFGFTLSDYHFTIQPADTTDFEQGTGTGPYILDSWEPGVRMECRRNGNYFREGKPHFDEVHVIGINDVTARTNALQTGEIDFMNQCELKTVHLLERNSKLQVFQTNGTRHYTIPMHVDVAPFDDVDVRQALKYGIDRQAVLDTILQGYGSVGNDHPIASSVPFYAADLPQREYDPDKARFHLKKAGLERLTVDLSTSDAAFAGAVDTAVLYQEQASKANIDINVVREPSDGYWDNVWLVKPWCFCFWSGRPTVDWMFTQAYADPANTPWNDTRWNNPRFNQLLVAARKELDESKRAEMYFEMQMLCRDDGGVVVPLFASDVQAAHADLRHGPVIGANWHFDGMKLAERWWWA